jgi:hypothetical protein
VGALGRLGQPGEIPPLWMKPVVAEELQLRQLNLANLKPVKLDLPFCVLLSTLTIQEYG